MKKFFTLALLSVSSFAIGGGYDWTTGNIYQSTGNGYRGYNAQTGSTWSAQSYGGRTTGIDSGGNSWSYDRNSGIYQNYGTGEMRFNTPRR